MRMVFVLVLILGAGLAGFAVYLANGQLNSYRTALAKAQNAEAVATVDVYVAAKKLQYGDKLDEKSVKKVKFPKASLPDGTFLVSGGATPYLRPFKEMDEDTREEIFNDPDAETNDNGLIVRDPSALFTEDGRDRFVLRTIERGEALISQKVTLPGQDAGITSRLDRGMRAFAIKVDVASGVSGFLRPGDRVDVYWTGRVAPMGEDRNRNSTDVTKLIETGVKLIAVDQTADGNAAATTIARTVTVSARPHQVAALAQAQSTGSLSLALVGRGDDSEVGPVEVDQISLLGLKAPVEEEVVEVKKEKVCTIRTRKGADLVEIPIPCTN